MPKTTFINGLTVMTAEWCNKAYVTDGGHKHDGVNADGHAQKINLNTEFTVGAQGKLEAPTESSELHVIRHDHAASGSAILQTDVLRLHEAPRDATRRAQAPLDQSLYLQNTPKLLYRATISGPAVIFNNVESYNVTGGLAFNPDDTKSYVLTAQDADNVQGVVFASFEGWDAFAGEMDYPSKIVAFWDDANARVVVLPFIDNGSGYLRLRDQSPIRSATGTYYISIAVW